MTRRIFLTAAVLFGALVLSPPADATSTSVPNIAIYMNPNTDVSLWYIAVEANDDATARVLYDDIDTDLLGENLNSGFILHEYCQDDETLHRVAPRPGSMTRPDAIKCYRVNAQPGETDSVSGRVYVVLEWDVVAIVMVLAPTFDAAYLTYTSPTFYKDFLPDVLADGVADAPAGFVKVIASDGKR